MTGRTLSPSDEFVNALSQHAASFNVTLSEDATGRLKGYFELVLAWNKRLHLVAPCPPVEFATRHVLESLLALQFLTDGSRVIDVGSGAGLPIIPCLIARPDINATLFEASPKKAVFLREALRRVDRHNAARVVAVRFEDAEPPEADFLTCRALDRFVELFPTLVAWSSKIKTMLLFGGPALREEFERAALPFTSLRIPESERRFLFVAGRTAPE
ncbi:MAG: 16S rRNA (guanine(527)-N(7))-methyltransferase RsmG [Acidobacteria bacterium]|nr:16S rRNA (guanine(527)-N(7))-methyltransferase RsmG [Acidobacteriota bacterium]